jgi:anti-anti-sigma factor
MDIGEKREGGVLILEPVGRFDKSSCKEFQDRVHEHLEADEQRIVVDLMATEQVDGTGLRELLTLNRKLDSIDGRLVLCAMSDQVRKAFHLGGLLRMFSIAQTREEALHMLSGDASLARIADLAAKLLARAEERDLAKRAAK